jgi:soluble P-type ATPase
MIIIQRSGEEPLKIESILIDFEGTLASDRRVHPKAKDKINLLSKRAKIYILVNEESEQVLEVLRKVKAEIIHVPEGNASDKKLNLLRQLGVNRTIAIGNGRDDALMVEEAVLGICVTSKEGTSSETIQRADVVVSNILDALDFLLKPLRQKATLSR